MNKPKFNAFCPTRHRFPALFFKVTTCNAFNLTTFYKTNQILN